MIVDVHVAFLIAALSVLFGMTYTLSKVMDHQIKRIKENREASETDVTPHALEA